ncbi:MAG: T9SS type A sorting domain-containing protein [Bacteroidales bacterium]|nr:MAG: T9SS type A sorting domain-containing protein [Bacteroidales bacterium]
MAVFAFLFIMGYSQNPPTIGTPENDTLYVNSGSDFLLIPEVNDNDEGMDQEINFNVTSSDETVLEIVSTEFTAGNRVAVIYVTEKGKEGNATVSIEANDGDGTASTSFQVSVTGYNFPGINFEIHDLVFWQENVPLNSTPAYSMIAPSGRAPYDSIDLDSLNLSVYSDCNESPPCTGTDFFTSFFRGYLLPPVTGTYKFYTRSGDQANLGISTDVNFENAVEIIHTSDGIGTPTGAAYNEHVSEEIMLQAGSIYAVYCTKWNIHYLTGGMLWEGPGIVKDYIDGQYLTYVYDNTKPAKPAGFNLVTTGLEDILIRWNESADDQKLESYCIYVNGHKVNDENILDTSYLVTGLLNNSRYSVAVSAIDWAGNESALSDVISTTTYGVDNTPPLPPTAITAPLISDIAASLSWSGAVDNETEIRGYKVYLNDELYNKEDLIYNETISVYNLLPLTAYNVEIEAVDAANNVSVKSEVFVFNTAVFDPADTRFGDNKARMNVEFRNIGTSAGLGINLEYSHGEFNNDVNQIDRLKELKPAAIRWGAITANSLNFSDYIGTGNSNNITLAEFMDIANELDAYTVITCGVENSTDWMNQPETFTNFLEYIAGPSSTEYGAIREAEGYPESLLENSKGLIFEFGNEVWGAEAHDAQIGSSYVTYREWAREMALLMKNSPYYNNDKISLVYSGRNPRPDESYGLNRTVLDGDDGEIEWLALSGYLGGNFSPEIETGDSELGYFKNGIARLHHEVEGLLLTMEDMVDLTGQLKPSFFYEANMTTNTFFGRLGQAVIQTDYYAEAIEHGGALPTIFHFTGGQWKIIVPAQDYKKLALYEAAKLFNYHCTGNILKTNVETEGVITDADGNTIDFEPVGCHAYTKNERFGLLLISRDFTRDYTLQVNLPDDFQFTGAAKKYVISGEHYSSTETTIDSSDVIISDSMIVVIPKYSMVVISFNGENLQFEALPLGYFDYTRATNINIRPKEDDGFDISTLRGSKKFIAEFEPADAFIKVAKWDVISNDVDVKFTINGNEIKISSTGKCEGNGTITLKASLKDNLEINDEVSINISNQGSDCDATGLTGQINSGWKVCPNPVNDGTLNLSYAHSQPDALVTVTDMTGKKVFQEEMQTDNKEIETVGWGEGIFTISIIQAGKIKSLKILIE